MTYGVNMGLFAGSGPIIHPAIVAGPRSSNSIFAWRDLDPERRLALVEEALAEPANDTNDGYSAAS